MQEKFDEAIKILLKGLKAQGDRDEVYLNLGLIKRSQRQYGKARSYLLKALAITPNYPSAKQALADVERWLKFTNSASGRSSERGIP